MEYIEKIGDLTKSAYFGFNNSPLEVPHFIVHGCNCEHTMGAGIALQMADKFNADRYELRHAAPGKISIFPITRMTFGINAYTQQKPGPFATYENIIECLAQINRLAAGKRVAFPAIGCGIGGLKWPVVRALIRDGMKDAESVTIYFLNEEEKQKLEQ